MSSALTNNILPLVSYQANTHRSLSFTYLNPSPANYYYHYYLLILLNKMAKQSTVARRATVVALKAYTTKSSAEIAALTELSVPSVNRIYAEAIKRGFDPIRTMVDNQYIEDKPRSSRPTKQDPSIVKIILSKVRLDRYGREKTCADLAGDLSELGINISTSTIRPMLKKAGFRKTKPTRKPRLTKKMRAERLAWCLVHEHWTIED